MRSILPPKAWLAREQAANERLKRGTNTMWRPWEDRALMLYGPYASADFLPFRNLACRQARARVLFKKPAEIKAATNLSIAVAWEAKQKRLNQLMKLAA